MTQAMAAATAQELTVTGGGCHKSAARRASSRRVAAEPDGKQKISKSGSDERRARWGDFPALGAMHCQFSSIILLSLPGG